MTSPDVPSNPSSSEAAGTPVRGADESLSLARSVAGEEDPGASLDAPTHVPPPAPGHPAAPAGAAERPGTAAAAPPPAPSGAMRPGDEAPTGTPGTGETLCRACGGSGRRDDGSPCPECAGQGRVTVGIGGG